MPNSISIGPVTFHMYGLMVALGLFAAVVVSAFRAKKRGMSEDTIYSILWASIVGGFLGTRILYYLTVLPDIVKDPAILWNFSNGYVVYGGVIGGVLANCIYFRIKKQEFLPYFDLVIPQVALGQAIGRIGCFFAGCCYGRETHLPIGFTYHTSQYAPTGVPLLPTQLISCLGDLLIFGLLLLYANRKVAKGTVGAMYMMLYSVGRFLIEFLRGDEERGNVGALSVSQWIAVVVFAVGILLYFVFRARDSREKIEETKAESVDKEKEEMTTKE